MRPASFLTLTLATLTFAAGTAAADVAATHRAAAERAFRRGEELARDHRYAEAATQFATAHGILATRGLEATNDARTAGEYLYGWAQAERLAGNCGCAIALYGDFRQLAHEHFPGSHNWPRKAEDGIAACPAVPPDRAACHGVTAPPAPPPAPPPPPLPPPRPWHRDPVGGALVVAGVLATAGGGWLVRSSFTIAERAGRPGVSYDDYDAMADDAELRARIGWPVLAGGLVLVTGAVVRYATADRDAPTRAAITLTPGAGGVTVGYLGRF